MNIELIATGAGYFVAIATAIGLITKLLILPHLERKIDEILKTRARREQGVPERKVYILKRHEELQANIEKARGYVQRARR